MGKERKSVFEKYVKERAEEERRERRNKLKVIKDGYQSLMDEANLTPKSSFSDFVARFAKDERFKAVEKQREREQFFQEFVGEMRKKEKEEKAKEKDKQRKDFLELLKDEKAGVDRNSRWTDVKQLIENDERFQAVDSSTRREDWFRDYVRELEREHKVKEREKEREMEKEKVKEKKDKKDRSRSRDRSRDDKKEKKRSRSRDRSRDRSRGRSRERSRRDKSRDKSRDKRSKSRDKSKERGSKEKESKKSKKEKKEKKNKKEKEKHHDDSEGEKEKEDKEDKEKEDKEKKENGEENGAEEGERNEEESEREKKAMEAIRKREEEVKGQLAGSLSERDKEREIHKHDEAVQHFNALLVDLIRTADLSWKDAKKVMRKDQRWDLVEALEREEKERLYDAHVDVLNKKKKASYHELLGECSEVTLTASWKDVKKAIKDDPRFEKFSSSDRRREREFLDYQREKVSAAKGELKALLMETKSITYKTKESLNAGDTSVKDIEEILSNDQRYLSLDFLGDERRELVMRYITDLSDRGAPPPPTASEPTRSGLSKSGGWAPV